MNTLTPAATTPGTDFRIDPEFASLCPEYTGDDALGLELSIRRDGVREPLVVWSEDKILLDGHRRLDICRRHALKFPTVEYSFANRQAARDWVIENQLSRRNLTPEQRTFLLGKRYAVERRDPSDTLRRGETAPSGQSDHAGRTAARVAAAAGVSEKTVRRAAKYAEDLDRIGASCPEAKTAILAGKAKLTRAQVAQAATAKPQTLAELRKLMGHVPAGRLKRRYVGRIEMLARQLRAAVVAYRKERFPDAELLDFGELRRLREVLAEVAVVPTSDGDRP